MIEIQNSIRRVDGLNVRSVALAHAGLGFSWQGHSFENVRDVAKADLTERIMQGLTTLPLDTAKLARLIELASLYNEVNELQEERGD